MNKSIGMNPSNSITTSKSENVPFLSLFKKDWSAVPQAPFIRLAKAPYDEESDFDSHTSWNPLDSEVKIDGRALLQFSPPVKDPHRSFLGRCAAILPGTPAYEKP